MCEDVDGVIQILGVIMLGFAVLSLSQCSMLSHELRQTRPIRLSIWRKCRRSSACLTGAAWAVSAHVCCKPSTLPISVFVFQGPSRLLRQIAGWKGHHARNLHSLLHRWGVTLPVDVSTEQVLARFGPNDYQVPWPILKPSSWLKTIFRCTNGSPLLGWPLEQKQEWADDLHQFWQRYRYVDPQHACYVDHASRLACCVPYMLHGDEGRGAAKRAIMVCSWQPTVQHAGHSYLSRLLTAVLPASRYASETTFLQIQDAIVEDLKTLYQEGFEAAWFTWFQPE